MKIGTLHTESISKLGMTIDEVIASLGGKTLIMFTIKSTALDPASENSQIVNIVAIALDADTGEQVDGFNEEADLSLNILRTMDKQDRMKQSGEMPEDEITIRDMLNAADYDLEAHEEAGYMSEIELALEFKKFIEQQADPILVTHNASRAMQALNTALPVPVRAPVIDVHKFAKVYFEPIVRALMMQGSKRATDMAEKMWDDVGNTIKLTIPNLGKALGVKRRKWHASMNAEEVYQLAATFRKMLKFLRAHKKMFSDPNFRKIAAKRIKES